MDAVSPEFRFEGSIDRPNGYGFLDWRIDRENVMIMHEPIRTLFCCENLVQNRSMERRPSPLDVPLPPSPPPAWLEAEHARMVAYLDGVGSYGAPTFDEDKILPGIDRLREIEAAMPPEMRARYVEPLDPWEDIPF